MDTLDHMFRSRVSDYPNTIAVCVPSHHQSPNAPYVYDQYTFAHLETLILRVASLYASQGIYARTPGETVTLLANSSFEYLIHKLVLLRLGFTTLFASPNNSIPALEHLLVATRSTRIIFSEKLKPKANATRHLLAQHQRNVIFQQWSESSSITGTPSQSHSVINNLPVKWQKVHIAYYLHSSGTTGFPKAIPITNLQACAKLYRSQFPTNAHPLCTAPLFHAFGDDALWRSMFHLSKAFLFTQSLVAQHLIQAIRGSSATQFNGVPFALKLLAEHKDGIPILAKMDLVLTAGSVCPLQIGNALVREHVKLVTCFGASEYGPVMSSSRHFDTDKAWDCLRLDPLFKPHARFEPRNPDTYELIIAKEWPALTRSNRPDGSYATNDLFCKHPTIPDGWNYLGRADDILVHYSGEKTNPTPMESCIRSSPLVTDCVIFGAGRAQPGVLILPSKQALAHAQSNPEASNVPTRDSQQAQHRFLHVMMMPVVAAANNEAPSHSRIIPELVKVMPPGTQFATADKGSLKRAEILQAFHETIDKVYQDYNAGKSVATVVKQPLATEQEAVAMIRQVVSATISLNLGGKEDSDLVELGTDSLAATRIRNMILQRTESLDLPNNVVFEHPTINKLAAYIFQLAASECGASKVADDDEQAKLTELRTVQAELEALILARPEIVCSEPDGETIVLTGSTGSLGAHILHQLAFRPTVSRIICLNRATCDKDAYDRTGQSLLTRGLPSLSDILSKRTDLRIQAFAADLAAERLGLSPEIYRDLLASTTAVIHNGWPVNFNMSLLSFQPTLLGSVNLLNLTTQSTGCKTPHFILASSVSAVMRRSTTRIEETESLDPSEALNMGYGQSKWVTERLCASPAISKIRTTVVRIGQMVGDSLNGIWNQSEAIPLQLKSAQTLGALPRLDGKVSWLPVDHAGWIFSRLTSSKHIGLRTLHLVNDNLTPFNDILLHLARPQNLGDTFRIVEPAEWLEMLENSSRNPSLNPTVKLLEHYKSMRSQDFSGKFCTKKLHAVLQETGEDDELVARFNRVDKDLVTRIVAAWRRTGFLA